MAPGSGMLELLSIIAALSFSSQFRAECRSGGRPGQTVSGQIDSDTVLVWNRLFTVGPFATVSTSLRSERPKSAGEKASTAATPQ